MSTGNLTAKENRLATLIALEGYDQSAAYREVYDVGEDTLPATVWSEASRLAADPKVSARITELRVAAQSQVVYSQAQILQELATIAFAERGTVKDNDKSVALDKMAKLSGYYTEAKTDQRPITLTKVTVILDHGDHVTQETKAIQAPTVEGTVVDAEESDETGA